MATKKKKGKNARFEEAALAFNNFCQTIAALRDKDTGCPWDLKQTHESLRRFMIEEAYEAVNVMAGSDRKALCEELGDVLLQVVLNAQVASDESTFTIVDVIKSIDRKMLHRHPHVFNQEQTKGQLTPEEVRTQWEVIKIQEKEAITGKRDKKIQTEQEKEKHRGYFQENRIDKVYPSTLQALEIGKLANKINFDWDHPREVMLQLASEIDELTFAMKEFSASNETASEKNLKELTSEIGDVYFTLAQLCRLLKLDPELTAHDGNEKFLQRFALLEELMRQDGLDPKCANRAVYEQYWIKAKNTCLRNKSGSQ